MAGRQEVTLVRRALLFLALACAAGSALAQASGYTWGWYIFNPAQDKGLSNLRFLLSGITSTLFVSVCAIALSVVAGVRSDLHFSVPTRVAERNGVVPGAAVNVSLLAEGIHLMPPTPATGADG